MFDVDVGGVAYRESETEEPGDEIVHRPTPAAHTGRADRLLRPPLPRALPDPRRAGARVITVPAAFTMPTGRDHWEVLMRARAIENQVFVIAADQIGEAPPHYNSYGRSMIVDPWGVVLAQAPDTECFIAADLDFSIQEEMRESLPSLANRRPEAYRWPEPA